MSYHLRKIYIAGQTDGADKAACHRKFARAEKMLARKGFAPVNPLKLNENGCSNWKWKDYLLHALDMIIECDSLYLLPDWKQSKSARILFLTARELQIKILFEDASQSA